ncbi:hypothetical protein CPB83DRAFT_887002 [Crepidotus variabilis]|uniref:GPI ethanolamine phosphate transferase 2 C-terminal domain-containing protein n=1 Tax=Crepidotus variabilis TaxID=179855 RepID=A0A9P6E6J5_9AGAR|nr:hypothetical protein CPB83DRAFT_887002 [Crepidotus variabilis]
MKYAQLALLFWVFVTHLTGIYLFTKGFLLTRLSLADASKCLEKSCGLAPTHRRAVVLIMDALRFDFITPDPPNPASPFHHNILTLPGELTASRPTHSFIYNSYADPPTATLQRIKGLTTGSLPTFVDIGNNFGGSSILEDSLPKQLKLAGRKLAFMGDDTWMSVFPDTFDNNMTFPFDSFNVEDLHTVDEGVIDHLFPLLEDDSKPFDFLVGHFLGVDHVGHRVGPDHPSMKSKLQQMNDVLKRVVEVMDDDTLLVVLGDHGMDRSGDHGGDGVFETSSAMWIYSKGPALSDTKQPIPGGLLQRRVFPETIAEHRAIQQIDIVPSLALLLGVPIPYNNLGTVIPELFWRGRHGLTLDKALEVNAAQIKSYLDSYRASPSGSELNEAWSKLQASYKITHTGTIEGESKWVSLMNFNRVALRACRSIWAQFNPTLMAFGLSVLGMGLCASWSIYSGFSRAIGDRDVWLTTRMTASILSAAVGAVIGIVGYFVFGTFLEGINVWNTLLFGASLASSMTFVVQSPPTLNLKSTPIILVIHACMFGSNSTTFWEDRIVPVLLVSSIIPYALIGFTAPNNRLRYRILGFSVLFAVCVRLISISTICREEQQPYCRVTFFSSASVPSPPLPVLYAIVFVSAGVPFVLDRFLSITKSNNGLAKTFLPIILTPTLLGAAAFWINEWVDSSSIIGDEWTSTLRTTRTWNARATLSWMAIGGSALWWLIPVCLHINVTPDAGGRQIKVLGFANAFGAPYLIFWTISFGVVYLCTQLTGQITLALGAVALLTFLEVLDSTRDAKAFENAFKTATTASEVLDPSSVSLENSQICFVDIVPIALLGMEIFYATGHQSTISSIQWKSAFLLTSTVAYPSSVVTVVLNSMGPIFLFAIAAPLVALWNKSPSVPDTDEQEKKSDGNGSSDAPALAKKTVDASEQVQAESTLAGLGVMIYYSALLLGTSVSAAILRRHLMVWKVFAPRFMAAILELMVVDVGVLLGVGVGVTRIVGRVSKLFPGRKNTI